MDLDLSIKQCQLRLKASPIRCFPKAVSSVTEGLKAEDFTEKGQEALG